MLRKNYDIMLCIGNFRKGSEKMENLEKTFPKTSINWLITIYCNP